MTAFCKPQGDGYEWQQLQDALQPMIRHMLLEIMRGVTEAQWPQESRPAHGDSLHRTVTAKGKGRSRAPLMGLC